jgi:hypothetical protein
MQFSLTKVLCRSWLKFKRYQQKALQSSGKSVRYEYILFSIAENGIMIFAFDFFIIGVKLLPVLIQCGNRCSSYFTAGSHCLMTPRIVYSAKSLFYDTGTGSRFLTFLNTPRAQPNLKNYPFELNLCKSSGFLCLFFLLSF